MLNTDHNEEILEVSIFCYHTEVRKKQIIFGSCSLGGALLNYVYVSCCFSM